MPSLKHFIEAMSASWPVALAIFMGSVLALIGEAYGVSYLTELPNWVLGTLFIIASFSAAVLMVAVIRAVSQIIQSSIRNRRIEKSKAEHIKKMDQLPDAESYILEWAAVHNTQVFLAPMQHHLLEPLIAKGFVKIHSGSHDMSRWPYSIPDHIWAVIYEEMKQHPDKQSYTYPFGKWR